MAHEPRMRGRRFGRPATKRTPAKKKGGHEIAFAYAPSESQTNVSQLSSSTLNAIKHLGVQRFALPPFAEHFRRWLKDLKSIVAEFETRIPQAVDQQYLDAVRISMVKLEESLASRIEEENKNSNKESNLQRRLTAIEAELSKMERDFKHSGREIRKRYGKSLGNLSAEIGSLDKDRLKMLREKKSLLQRILRKPRLGIEEKTEALRFKRKVLSSESKAMEIDLLECRSDYQKKRRRLVATQEELQKALMELRGSILDDALEVRKVACEELYQAVTKALAVLPRAPHPPEQRIQEMHEKTFGEKAA